MKFLIQSALFLAFSLQVSFSAAATTAGPRPVVNFAKSSGQAQGAAYFASNDPSGNYIFAADINPDSTLTLRNAYYTKGNGAHGNSSVVNNALFSAHSVYVFQPFKALLVVNAGSNSITPFEIDPKDPSTLLLHGTPPYSGGDFPIAIAVENNGTMACVLNTGAINGVSCFGFDPVKGLVPLPNTTRYLNLPQTSTIPSGPDYTASDISFTADGTKLVVAVKGSMLNPKAAPGYLAVWNVNKDRTLSSSFTTVQGGVWIWGILQIPGQNAFIGGDGVTGVEVYNLNAPKTNQTRVQNIKVKGQIGICWVVYSNVTGNFYLTDLDNPSLDEIHVDSNLKTTVVASHPLDFADAPSDLSLAHVNGQDVMYVLTSGTTSVEVVVVEGPGKLHRIQKLNVGPLAKSSKLAFDPSNNYGIATYIGL